MPKNVKLNIKEIGKKSINMLKLYTKPTQKIIDIVNKGYNDYPFSFRDMLSKFGSDVVNSIVIVRTPLSKVLSTVLNIASLGQLDNKIKNSEYDNMFHLKIIVNNKFSIEKAHVITFTKSNQIPPKSDTVEVQNIPSNLTILDMLDNTKKLMGKQMFNYNAINNNCQKFISQILKSNMMDGYDQFIMQDIQSIFNGLKGLKQLSSAVTNVANKGNILIEGEGFRPIRKFNKLRKLTTLSDSDINSIAIKLKLKLQGIFMKDELPKNLNNGLYIINLENHNQGGSHWTALIIKNSNAYYMDSYGVVPPQDVWNDLKDHCNNIYYCTQQKQFVNSTSCGWWAIAFLYFVTNVKPNSTRVLTNFTKFNKLFDNDTKLNENRLAQYITSIYPFKPT